MRLSTGIVPFISDSFLGRIAVFKKMLKTSTFVLKKENM